MEASTPNTNKPPFIQYLSIHLPFPFPLPLPSPNKAQYPFATLTTCSSISSMSRTSCICRSPGTGAQCRRRRIKMATWSCSDSASGSDLGAGAGVDVDVGFGGDEVGTAAGTGWDVRAASSLVCSTLNRCRLLRFLRRHRLHRCLSRRWRSDKDRDSFVTWLRRRHIVLWFCRLHAEILFLFSRDQDDGRFLRKRRRAGLRDGLAAAFDDAER